MNLLQGADVAPTANQRATISVARAGAASAMARWTALKTTDLAALNSQLAGAGLDRITLP